MLKSLNLEGNCFSMMPVVLEKKQNLQIPPKSFSHICLSSVKWLKKYNLASLMRKKWLKHLCLNVRMNLSLLKMCFLMFFFFFYRLKLKCALNIIAHFEKSPPANPSLVMLQFKPWVLWLSEGFRFPFVSLPGDLVLCMSLSRGSVSSGCNDPVTDRWRPMLLEVSCVWLILLLL